MNRRSFLRQSVALAGLAWCRAPLDAQDQKPQVMTVQGPLAAEQMGFTLVHEHILVDFSGADKVRKDRYDPDAVFKVALPHLKRIKDLGCQTFVDCTPAYLGRDAALLKRLAAASGLRILTNTGFYGARQGKFLPDLVMKETAEQLAARWLREWKDGIDGTGIKPGFIKVGVDAGVLPEVNRKLLQAAARTHLDSGLTIAAHTGDGIAALEELKLVREAGVDGNGFIWVHAQNEKDTALHVRAAEQGAWVEFDGVGAQTVERHVELVKAMKSAGHLGRVLLSHDAGWYHVGEPDGGKFRPFDTLFTDLLPALKKAGFTDAELKQLTVDSPREALTVRVRAGKALEQIDKLKKLGAKMHLDDQKRVIGVHLGERKVTDADLAHLQGLDRLQELDLTRTRITSAGLVHLKDLISLKKLFLTETKVDDAGIGNLKGMKSLEVLGLSGTRIGDPALAELEALRGLKSVFCIGTGVTEAGVTRFQKALPDCRIAH